MCLTGQTSLHTAASPHANCQRRNVDSIKMVCDSFVLWHYRTLYPQYCHAPLPPPTWRSGMQRWGCRDWRGRMSQERRRLRGDGVFCSTQILSHQIRRWLLFASSVRAFLDKGVCCRSWQAESVDSGCSNSTAFTAPCSEGLCVEGICITTGGRCDQTSSKLCTVKVKSAAVEVCSCTVPVCKRGCMCIIKTIIS